MSHSTPRSCVITNRLLFHIRSGEAPWNIAGRTFNPWAVWPNHVSSRWPEGRQPATFTCRAPKPRVLQDTPQIRARQIYQFGSLPAQHGTQCIQGEAFDLLGGNGRWDGKFLAFGHHIQNGGAVMGEGRINRLRPLGAALAALAPEAHGVRPLRTVGAFQCGAKEGHTPRFRSHLAERRR